MRKWIVASQTLFVLIGIVITSVPAMGQHAQGMLFLSDGSRIPLTPENRLQYFGDPEKQQKAVESVTFSGITWNLDYQDDSGVGFNDSTLGAARKDTLELALAYVSDVLNEPGGVVDAVVRATTVNTVSLATAGPSAYTSTSPGNPNNGAVFQHIMDGTTDPSAGVILADPDMTIDVNFFQDFNLGEGLPASNESDLLSVLIHEITHALGFLSVIVYDDDFCLRSPVRSQGMGWFGDDPDDYTTFDRLVSTGNGNPFISVSPPLSFEGADNFFTGGDNGVFFTGTNASAIFGSNPELYAPPTFVCGSSISHWAEGVTAVMEHARTEGEILRTYADFEIAALIDLGYTNAAAPDGDPMIAVSPTGIVDFGDIDVGDTTTENFTVTNIGSGDLDGMLSSDTAEFTVVGSASYSLTPGEDVVVQVQFAPLSEGDFSGTLTFSGGDNGPITVDVTGTGEAVVVEDPELSVSPTGSRNFGDVDVDDFVDLVWTIENTGTGTLNGTITSDDPDFDVRGSSSAYALTAGGTVQFTVRFRPLVDGSFSGTLTFTNEDDASQDITITVTGTGVALPATGCAAAPTSAPWGGDLLVLLGMGLFLSMSVIRRPEMGPGR